MENWCEQVEVLKAMSMLKNIYNLALIIIPVILVIVLMVSFIKKVFSDDDNYKELISSSLRKFFSVVVIVFLPNLIISVLSFTMNGRFDSDLLCLDKANEAGISALQVASLERMKANNTFSDNEIKKQQVAVSDAKNKASSIITAAEKSLSYLGNRVTQQEKTEINRLKNELQEAITLDSVEEINKKADALNAKVIELDKIVYADQANSVIPVKNNSYQSEMESLQNKAYRLISDVSRMVASLKESGDNDSASVLETLTSDLKIAVNSGNANSLSSKIEELENKASEINKKAYKEIKKDSEDKTQKKNDSYSTSGQINPYTYISKTFTPIVNGVQRPLNDGECMSWEDNCFCPNKKNAKGFQFIMESETGRNFKETTAKSNSVTIKDTCDVISNRNSISVSKDVQENFEKALELLCKLKTTGINGFKINQIRTNGTYAMRTKADRTVCSPHSYGIAIDFSSGVTIDYNGKTYDPYSGQGTKTKERYDAFISALGSEANESNVNYIIWKYAFEPAGFEWGGEWKVSSFDPMHYEVKP